MVNCLKQSIKRRVEVTSSAVGGDRGYLNLSNLRKHALGTACCLWWEGPISSSEALLSCATEATAEGAQKESKMNQNSDSKKQIKTHFFYF